MYYVHNIMYLNNVKTRKTQAIKLKPICGKSNHNKNPLLIIKKLR